MLLAIDTSAGTSVAVVGLDGTARAERAVVDTRRHAEVIGDLIRQCLQEAGAAPGDLTAVAAGMGPGPFTGLRVGIAAARAFAQGAGIPVLPVVSHDAVAAAVLESDPESRLLVVTDARRHEHYWSAYEGLDADGLPLRAEGPALAARDDVPAARGARVDAESVSAVALGGLAARRRALGRPADADRALYLRTPDVTPSAGPKRVTA